MVMQYFYSSYNHLSKKIVDDTCCFVEKQIVSLLDYEVLIFYQEVNHHLTQA